MTKDQVIRLLREACERAGSQKAWADQAKVTQAYVNDVLAGRRNPGWAILDALGLEREMVYRRRK